MSLYKFNIILDYIRWHNILSVEVLPITTRAEIFIVAEAGIEPATFRVWAWRATSALFRDIIPCIGYEIRTQRNLLIKTNEENWGKQTIYENVGFKPTTLSTQTYALSTELISDETYYSGIRLYIKTKPSRFELECRHYLRHEHHLWRDFGNLPFRGSPCRCIYPHLRFCIFQKIRILTFTNIFFLIENISNLFIRKS